MEQSILFDAAELLQLEEQLRMFVESIQAYQRQPATWHDAAARANYRELLEQLHDALKDYFCLVASGWVHTAVQPCDSLVGGMFSAVCLALPSLHVGPHQSMLMALINAGVYGISAAPIATAEQELAQRQAERACPSQTLINPLAQAGPPEASGRDPGNNHCSMQAECKKIQATCALLLQAIADLRARVCEPSTPPELKDRMAQLKLEQVYQQLFQRICRYTPDGGRQTIIACQLSS